MKQTFRRFITMILALSMLVMVNLSVVYADEAAVVTFGVEYTSEDTATVTLYSTIIDAFDLGVIYDPSLLSVEDCGYTMEFKKLQVGGENTTISVKNEDAKDDSGNTYVVFTGAGTNNETGKSIDFSGKPLAYITFKGNLSAANIKVVSDTATMSNVNDANLLGELMLDGEKDTEVTPKPIENVVYISPEPTETKNEEGSTVGNEKLPAATEQTGTIGGNDAVNEDIEKSTEEPVVFVTERAEETEAPSAKVNASQDDKNEASDTIISPLAVCIVIMALVIITVIIIVVVKKKKK